MKKALLLAALAVSCSGPSFDPSSKVESVRILATSADKPYAAPGDMVNMSVLAFDGRSSKPAPMNVYWLPSACTNPSGDAYFACFPFFAQSFRPGMDIESLLSPGTTFAFRMPADAITAHPSSGNAAPYGLAVVFTIACAGHVQYAPTGGGSPDAPPFGCFDDAGTRLGADDFVFAYSLVYAFADRTNANPVIESVTYGGTPVDPAMGIPVDRCAQSNIDDCPTKSFDTVVPPSSQEADPSNLDANGNILKEQIYVDYYVTGGKLKNDTIVLFDPREGRISGTGDDFAAAQVAGDYLLWVVVHDNRGGVAWQELVLHVR